MITRKNSPSGMSAFGTFLFFGAMMAALAGTTLFWPGTDLDRIWLLNPRAYNKLAPFGKAMAIPFLLLGVALAVAGLGWFKRSPWAWRLAVGIIGTQVLGNFVNVFFGHLLAGAIGISIAGTLLFYLFRPEVRKTFENGSARSAPVKNPATKNESFLK